MQQDVAALSDHASYLTNKTNFLLDATLGLINLEQNQIIKIFSIAAVCLMPPTLVASSYGMNFKNMPELEMAVGLPLCAPTDADHRDHSVRLAQRLAVTRVRCNDALTQRNRAETANVFGTTRADPIRSGSAPKPDCSPIPYVRRPEVTTAAQPFRDRTCR